MAGERIMSGQPGGRSTMMTGKQKRKVGRVMGEYKRGKLDSSAGGKVTDRKQAIAIALSEARRLGK